MSDQTENIAELASALAKAQGAIVNAAKDTENTFFHSRYATLASVWDACRKPLADNGLAVVQTVTETDRGQVLVTTLAHASGQWMRSHYPVVPVKQDPQGFGSALTYARRYALSAMVGVAPADDDGEAAVGRGGNGFDKLDRKPQQAPPRAVQSVPKAAPPPKLALPPIPDKLTQIPTEVLQFAVPLRGLTGVEFDEMDVADLELCSEQCKLLLPKFKTDDGKRWLTAIIGEAQHRIGQVQQ